eukprot:g4895.t1
MSSPDEYIQKLKYMNVKQQRELIHVKKFYVNQWNRDQVLKEQDEKARRAESEKRKILAKARIQKLKETKFQHEKEEQESLERFLKVQDVKSARIQRELNFESTSSATKHLNRMNVILRQLEQYSESLLREYARDESHALDQISHFLSDVTSRRDDNKLRKRFELELMKELTEKHNNRKKFSLDDTCNTIF